MDDFSKPFDATIDVTTGDIAAGVPRRCSACPIALAVKRRFPSAATVLVVDTEVELLGLDGRVFAEADMPKAGADFMYRFDSRKAVGPISLPLHFRPTRRGVR